MFHWFSLSSRSCTVMVVICWLKNFSSWFRLLYSSMNCPSFCFISSNVQGLATTSNIPVSNALLRKDASMFSVRRMAGVFRKMSKSLNFLRTTIVTVLRGSSIITADRESPSVNAVFRACFESVDFMTSKKTSNRSTKAELPLLYRISTFGLNMAIQCYYSSIQRDLQAQFC